MKWFKHLSTARDDERIAKLEDVAGLEGYGFYFKLLEIVAQTMDGSNKCEAEYSFSRWGKLTNLHPTRARTLLLRVASCSLVEVQVEETSALVRIPNLLKFRDNHTKNLQAADKQEEEKEQEQEKEKPVRPLSVPVMSPKFEEFWRTYPGPRKIQKRKCWEMWTKAGLEAVADQVILHVAAMAASPSWKDQDGKYVPSPGTYLGQRRFEDGAPDAPRPRLVI